MCLKAPLNTNHDPMAKKLAITAYLKDVYFLSIHSKITVCRQFVNLYLDMKVLEGGLLVTPC